MDESLWPAALQATADLMDSQAATFWVLDRSENTRLPTFVSFNFDPEAVQEYLERTAAIDPTVRYLVENPHHPIVHDGLVISEREKKRHPYYDWHHRRIETRFRMVGQTAVTRHVQAGIALHRTQKAGRYEPGDIRRFALVYRHLQRALRIGVRLGSLGAMQKLTAEWLDRNTAAVLFLDHGKRIIFANRAAHALQSRADGIRWSRGSMALTCKPDDDRLQELIARALSPIASPDHSAAAAMCARRPSGKRPYGIQVCPVSAGYPALSMLRPSLCVVITDPESRPPLRARRLREIFGLTEAEARLAALVAAGEELRSAAEKLKITYGTARTRLAQIFQKTGTKRQGELVRLLLTVLGPDASP